AGGIAWPMPQHPSHARWGLRQCDRLALGTPPLRVSKRGSLGNAADLRDFCQTCEFLKRHGGTLASVSFRERRYEVSMFLPPRRSKPSLTPSWATSSE